MCILKLFIVKIISVLRLNIDTLSFFAEFPDENGRMKKYITEVCPRDEFKYRI